MNTNQNLIDIEELESKPYRYKKKARYDCEWTEDKPVKHGWTKENMKGTWEGAD
jgi:hypothetical protein